MNEDNKHTYKTYISAKGKGLVITEACIFDFFNPPTPVCVNENNIKNKFLFLQHQYAYHSSEKGQEWMSLTK